MNLSKHVKWVHDNFKCETCGILCNDSNDLDSHIDSVHEGIKAHKCNYCQKGFNGLINLKNHIETVHFCSLTQQFKCEICGIRFGQASDLKLHIKEHYADPDEGMKIFKCGICKKTFGSAIEIKNHIKEHDEPKSQEYKFRYAQEIPDNIPNIKCYYCEELFNLRAAVTSHMNTYHPGLDKEKCFCNICGKTLSISHVKYHIKFVHEGVKEHKCSACGYSACQISDLKRHMMRHHTGTSISICNISYSNF